MHLPAWTVLSRKPGSQKKPGVVFDGVLPGTASTTTAQNPPKQTGIAFGTLKAVAAIDHAVLGNRWHRERQDEQRQQGDPSYDSSMRHVGLPTHGGSLNYSLRVRHKYCKVTSYFGIVLHLLAQKVGQS